MKKILLSILVFMGASSAFAKPLLTCKTSGAGGAVFKQVVVERGANGRGLVVKAESYANEGLQEIKITQAISTPVSSKYVLDVHTGTKTSLVMFEKQAVILYEASTPDQLDENGATVEFLTCK